MQRQDDNQRSSRDRLFDKIPFINLDRETRQLNAVLIAHFVLWTIAPTYGFATPPLDIVENLFWGQEWPLGTYKHPPLQAWLCEIAWQLASLKGVYALSQLCVLITSLGLFLLGRDIKSPEAGLVGALIYLFSFYATLSSPEFNANVVSAPFWVFASLFLWRIINNTKKTLGIQNWIGLTLAVTLAFYSKYSVCFLLIGLFLASMISPSGRAILKSPLLYTSASLTIFLCAPNLLWLLENDFQPLQYAMERSLRLEGMSRLTNPISFLFGVILAFLVPLLLLFAAGARSKRLNKKNNGTNFLLVLALTPLSAMIIFSLVGSTGLKSMWGSTAAVWLPLVISTHLTAISSWPRLEFAKLTAICLFLFMPVAAAGYSIYSENTDRPQRTGWPGSHLSKISLDAWEKNIGGLPSIIIGPTWEAGVLAYFSDNRPSVLINGDYKKSPWLSPDDIKSRGALAVWTGSTEHFDAFRPFKDRGTIPIKHKGKSVQFHWAIIEPKIE